MDPNLLFWRSEGQTFFSRLKIWLEVLNPFFLLSSDLEIQKAHSLLGKGGKLSEKDEHGQMLSLSSVHADSGAVLPVLFRSPAFSPVCGPLMVLSFLPHKAVTPTLFWQFLLQTYNARFNYANRSSSSAEGKKKPLKQLLVTAGTVSYATCAGALPQILINRLGIRSSEMLVLCRSIIPVPLSAAIAFLNVFTIRFEEMESGIPVFDFNGNPVGLSKAAGEKAVKETAWSRAALFGSTTAAPSLLMWFLQRSSFFRRHPLQVAFLRYSSIFFVLGFMVPISFSLFPQLGTIKTEKVEEELRAKVNDGQLYYHRGL